MTRLYLQFLIVYAYWRDMDSWWFSVKEVHQEAMEFLIDKAEYFHISAEEIMREFIDLHSPI